MSTTADGTEADERIQATIVSCDEGPDQCTLHPVEPDDSRETTEWITANEGSFVSVDTRR